MKSNSLIVVFVGLITIGFAGCQKDALKDLTAGESRIYVTNHDSTVNFSSFKTFSIADSVGVFENNQVLGKDLSSVDAMAISAVTASMQARGFQLVNRTDSPDVGITVSRIYNTSTGIMSYPGYWDTYGSYYDPFYWGYDGYSYYDPTYYGPTYYTTYQVTQGALSVDMLNLKDAANNNTIRPLWSGIARGTGVFATSAIDGEIAALFDQSPYLATNK
jgi:hypothetical protein